MLKKSVNLLVQTISKFNFAFEGIQKKCINIGCGTDLRPFWMNCDISPENDEIVKLDITNNGDLKWLQNQHADVISCNHVIGYLTIAQADNFFKSCHKSLSEKGILILEFPDIYKIMKKLMSFDYNSENKDEEYIEIIRAIYAYDHEDAMSLDFNLKTYITGWTPEYLTHRLQHAGFTEIKIKEPLTHDKRVHRDTRIEAYK